MDTAVLSLASGAGQARPPPSPRPVDVEAGGEGCVDTQWAVSVVDGKPRMLGSLGSTSDVQGLHLPASWTRAVAQVSSHSYTSGDG